MDRNEPPAHLTPEERAWLQGEVDVEETVTLLPPLAVPGIAETADAGPSWSPSASLSVHISESASITPSPTPSPSDSLSGTFSVEVSGSDEPTEEEQRLAAIRRDEWNARQQAEYAARETAEARARELLVSAIGEPAVRTMEAGGTFVIQSSRWPGTEYHIPKVGEIKIVRGGLWQNVCIVAVRGGLPWADVALARIRTIQTNETIVQARGNLMRGKKNTVLDKIVHAIEDAYRRR